MHRQSARLLLVVLAGAVLPWVLGGEAVVAQPRPIRQPIRPIQPLRPVVPFRNPSLTPVQLQTLLPLRDLTVKPALSALQVRQVRQFTLAVASKTANPPVYSLAQYQTPITNQRGRGTCWIMATTGAIEAFYKRKYGVTLNLSEQYFQHVAKSTTLDYPQVFKYENQSSYWNGGNSHAATRKAMQHRIPLEQFATYLSDARMDALRSAIPAAGPLAWKGDPAQNLVTQEQVDAFEYSPLYIPAAARANARYGVTRAVFLDAAQTRDVGFLEKTLQSNSEIIVDFDLMWRYDPATGVHVYDANNHGGHVMLVIGYDRNQKYFLLKNSWGEASYLKVSYEFMQKASSGGAIITGVVDPNTPPSRKELWIGRWNSDHDGWRGTLIVRRIPDVDNAATRLGTYIGNDTRRHTANGRFTPELGLAYHVDFSQTVDPPGTMVGQSFRAFVYSADRVFAAGSTTQGGATYGLLMCRNPLPARPYSNSFNRNGWLGTWSMNHDGWKGSLKINRITPMPMTPVCTVGGTYTDSRGQVRTVSGVLQSASPKTLALTIAFPGNAQQFALYHHSWEKNIFSGTTIWNGRTFGAHGLK